MREDDFNLIHQPWIRVRRLDASLDEVSISNLFRNAHTYRSLAGELATQDVAILRMLLAILHTVFSRVNTEGIPNPLDEMAKKESKQESLMRWMSLWERKQFPMKPIEDYLSSVEDRFWLFDEEHPFYQVPSAKTIAGLNTKHELKCKATKLNAVMNQSENKNRIFKERTGQEGETLAYPEAARWLVHMVTYDDCAVKKSDAFKKSGKKEAEVPGVGWLGKLGLVYAEGDNLFETMVLNMVMWPNGKAQTFFREQPIWEQDSVPGQEREKISPPENMAGLLTFPSRYVLLEKENSRVRGAYPVFGPFFDSGIPLEQMTRRLGQLKPEKPYEPLRHEKEVFLWQEFDSLFSGGVEEDDSRPGVVRWINRLQDRSPDLNQNRIIRFCSVGMFYDKNKSSIEQVESDHLGIHANLISDIGTRWRQVISEELAFAEKAADRISWLAQDLRIAAAGEPKKDKKGNIIDSHVIEAKKQGKARFYEAMDLPFRDWLRNISAAENNTEEKRKEWRDRVRQTAHRIGKELVDEAGQAAYRGHIIKQEGKRDQTYTTPAVYNRFCWRINHL